MIDTQTTGRVDVLPLTEIDDDDAVVAVRRVETPKGARLELEALESGKRIRLDAVTLECLTWQDRSTFATFLESQLRPLSTDSLSVEHEPNGETTTTTAAEITRITNEFGHVEVSVPTSGDHVWLELAAAKLGFAIRLNAVALESIAWQEQDTFTELIRNRLEK